MKIKKYIFQILFFIFTSLTFYQAGDLFLESITKLSLTDFHVYYYVPKMVITDTLPMFPYISFAPIYPYFFPPASLPFLYPLSVFPFYISKILWTVLNFTLLFGSIYLILKSFNKLNIFYFTLLLFLSVNFYPLTFTIRDGQFNVVLLFIFSLGLYAFVQNKFSKFTALAIAIGVISKISPDILLAYALWKRKYKFIFYSLLGVFFFMILAEIFVQPKINYYYFRNVISKVSDQSNGLNWREQSTLALIKKINNKESIEISKTIQSIISYSVVLFLLGILILLELKNFKSKHNDFINVSILTFIGVTGTGLTWFHQYSITLLSLFVMLFLSVFYLSKYRVYFIVSFIAIYLLWAFDLERVVANFGYLELNMFWGGWWFLINAYYLKANQKIVNSNFYGNFPKFQDKIFYTISFSFFLIGLNVWNINNQLKESRDQTRISNLNYIGKNLSKGGLNFEIGSSESTLKTNRVDRGYTLLDKESTQKALNRFSVLYLDPINNQEFKYIFK